MLSRSLMLLASALLVGGSVFATAPEASAQRERRRPRIRQVSPSAGETVKVGDVVTIEWEFVDGSGVILTDDQMRWCEQEIYLSLDNGRTIDRRITIRLDPAARVTQWVVPNTPTNEAMLDLHYGCEADGLPHEVRNLQKGFRFKIVPGDRKPREISLKTFPKEVFAGENLELSWETDLDTGTQFDVQVSYDRGGEFTSVGTTGSSSFSWPVPGDYRGSLTFRVVAQTPNGETIESPILISGQRSVSRRR